MNYFYQKATFLSSVPRVSLAPPDEGYEIAFAGRSNAGKSSAINAITMQKSLARTSKTPGRTQQLNFFELDKTRRIVDLPGYGYAKVPDRVQRQWKKAMEDYFTKRRSLCGIYLVMDIRHPMSGFDQQMVEWCKYNQLALHIALTKADKLKRGAGKNTLLQIEKTLRDANVPASVQLFSALKKIGVDEAHKVLDRWLRI